MPFMAMQTYAIMHQALPIMADKQYFSKIHNCYTGKSHNSLVTSMSQG